MSSVNNEKPNRTFIGLGSNLGDRVQYLVDAKDQLSALENTQDVRCSSLYESSPIGFADQAKFINCVIELDFCADHKLLFSGMQTIEQNLGRTRDPNNQNASRSIDLDLLLFGSYQSNDPQLIIPHPRMNRRLFVLIPLRELQPQLNVPGLGSIDDLLKVGNEKNYFDQQEIRKLDDKELGDWVSA